MLFFFSSPGALLALHSFPTRRSSDLIPEQGTARGDQDEHGRVRSGLHECAGDDQQESTGKRQSERSEEHTSELQSLTNLVCRLLLEKKKKKKQNLEQNKTNAIYSNQK